MASSKELLGIAAFLQPIVALTQPLSNWLAPCRLRSLIRALLSPGTTLFG